MIFSVSFYCSGEPVYAAFGWAYGVNWGTLMCQLNPDGTCTNYSGSVYGLERDTDYIYIHQESSNQGMAHITIKKDMIVTIACTSGAIPTPYPEVFVTRSAGYSVSRGSQAGVIIVHKLL